MCARKDSLSYDSSQGVNIFPVDKDPWHTRGLLLPEEVPVLQIGWDYEVSRSHGPDDGNVNEDDSDVEDWFNIVREINNNDSSCPQIMPKSRQLDKRTRTANLKDKVQGMKQKQSCPEGGERLGPF